MKSDSQLRSPIDYVKDDRDSQWEALEQEEKERRQALAKEDEDNSEGKEKEEDKD